MALTEPNPPHAVSLAYTTGIANFLKPTDLQIQTYRGRQHAQQVFVLGLNELAKGGQLKDARLLGWRFLSGGPSGNATTAEVLAAGSDGQPHLTGLSRGFAVARHLGASQDIGKLQEAEGRELRVVAIPGLLTEAFWLKAIPGKSKSDFVVPFLTTAKEFLAMKPYPAATFLATAQKLARERLASEELLTKRRPQAAKSPVKEPPAKTKPAKKPVKLKANAAASGR